MSNWWVLIKQSYELTLFHCSLLQQTTTIKKMGLCKEKHVLFFKKSAFGANILVTEFGTKVRRRPLWMIFETLQRRTAAAHSCRWGDWRIKTSPGLCPCKGTPFWTFVVILDATYPLLHFLVKWLNMLWYILITYYNNAWFCFWHRVYS